MKNLAYFAMCALLISMGSGASMAVAMAAHNQKSASVNQNEKGTSVSQEKAQLEDKAEAQLRQFDKEIAQLKVKASNEGKEAKKQYDRELPVLEQKRDDLQKRLVRFENSSEAAWGDMKPGIEAAMNDLEAAFHRAASHYK